MPKRDVEDCNTHVVPMLCCERKKPVNAHERLQAAGEI